LATLSAVDCSTLLLPPIDLARKTYVQSLRTQIDTFFGAGSYPSANNYIQYIEKAIIALAAADYPFTSNTFVLTSTDEFTITIGAYTPLGGSVVSQGGWYNIITNTLTEVEYPYTWEFDLQANSTKLISKTSIFPDGVYKNYSSEILVGLLFSTLLHL